MFLATRHIDVQRGLGGILIDRLEDYVTGVRCPPKVQHPVQWVTVGSRARTD